MTITIGWWIVPLLVTLGAFGWVFLNDIRGNQGGYGNLGGLLDTGAALIVTLFAWFLWALLR